MQSKTPQEDESKEMGHYRPTPKGAQIKTDRKIFLKKG